MGAGQIPMYYGMNLYGPDPYDHIKGDGSAYIQYHLDSVGDYRSRHPEHMGQPIPTNNLGNYPCGGYGTAGYGGYSNWPDVIRGTGSQFADPGAGAYYNASFGR
jgi:hypothetical protein